MLRADEVVTEVARRSYGKLVAFLAVRTGDVAAAEDALSEAFAAALADWPKHGSPTNPEAWLLTVARRKAIDAVRRSRGNMTLTGHLELVAEALVEDEIPDRRLALLFACAHPAIDAAVRAPLMLQAVLGLDAHTIASAFLVSPATMGKRLVRAKNKIKQARIPFRIPDRVDMPERLDTVLDAIYAAYACGWSSPAGSDLTAEAIFLARLAAELLPSETETLGLLALILHAEARRQARRNEAGEYVPLANQNPEQWDWPMIQQAESLLQNASVMGSIGRYQLEAAIQSAHVFRICTGKSNWDGVVRLYDSLHELTGSPVVAINRALAIAELHGARAGLAAMPDASGEMQLHEYQPYWAARAELLARIGSNEEARHAYEIAIGLERDPAVQRFLKSALDRISQPGEDGVSFPE